MEEINIPDNNYNDGNFSNEINITDHEAFVFTSGESDEEQEATREEIIEEPEYVPHKVKGFINLLYILYELIYFYNFQVFSSLNEKLFTTRSDLTVDDILFMVLNQYVRHGLTQTAVEDILKMLNTISGTKLLPECFSAFISHFQFDPYQSSRIFYCSECQFDYGSTAQESNVPCPICKSKEKDFFVSIPVEPQVRDLVQEYASEIEEYGRYIKEHAIADVMRGDYAQRILKQHSRPCLTLSVNTDGAATYRCTTQKPLYPVFVTLNNLPPKLRFSKHNLMLCGIWLSKGEPNTNLLFKYLCLELRRLQQDGLTIGSTTFSVLLLQVNLDSVARCKVQNIKQYNGSHGCTYCLHPGEMKASNFSRCYPYLENVSKREDTSTRRLMNKIASTGTEELGVMGKTVFTFLPNFDVIACFPPDYMHSVLLGAMKQLWSLWTESEHHKQPFYIGNRLKDIESRILNFRPPSAFPRYPRQLNEYKKFKANEWEPILIHYMYPALVDILPEQYMDHVMLLSSSIYQLLDPKLNETVVSTCEKNWTYFYNNSKDYMANTICLTTYIYLVI